MEKGKKIGGRENEKESMGKGRKEGRTEKKKELEKEVRLRQWEN